MKRCSSCGFENEAHAAHCVDCGAALGGMIAATAPGAPLSSAAAPPPRLEHPLPKGTVVDGKYAIVRLLGQGGMGVVYLAQDVHTGIEVVLKAVRSELAHREDIRRRTLAEGRTLARIDHPNVVHLNAVVAEGPELWLVMQYIEGEALDQTIRRHREAGSGMPLSEVSAVFEQVLGGVGAAHAEGVIHRDLKPANVLLRKKDGVAKVTDFGIAKPEEKAREGKGDTKGIIGSLWYMSPEQIKGRRDLDKRVDIYSLGIMLYEMLVGVVPFDAPSSYDLMKKHTEEPLPRLAEKRPGLPMALQTVLDRACAKERDDRFGSAQEFRDALQEALRPAATAPGEPLPFKTVTAAPLSQAAAPPGPNAPSSPPSAGRGAPSTEAPSTEALSAEAPFSASREEGHGASVTGPASAYTSNDGVPAQPKGRGWIWAALGLLVVGLSVGGAFAAGIFDPNEPKKAPTPATSSTPVEAPASASASAVVDDAPSPLEALAGRWRSSNGADFEAVTAGDVVLFRIVDAEQFAPADYRDGEVRFSLRATDTPSVFSVEDSLRPLPPTSASYDPKARSSCQEVWTEADGKPLTARFDGTQLTVELAKIEPLLKNFIQENYRVTSCVGLSSLPSKRVQSTLQRADP